MGEHQEDPYNPGRCMCSDYWPCTGPPPYAPRHVEWPHPVIHAEDPDRPGWCLCGGPWRCETVTAG